jgi:hypothetical protein
MEEKVKVIDIEKEFRSSKSLFFRSLPGFVISFIKRFLHEDEMNATIHRSRHLEGVPFIDDVLDGWNVEITIRGGENVPAAGRFISPMLYPLQTKCLAGYQTSGP